MRFITSFHKEADIAPANSMNWKSSLVSIGIPERCRLNWDNSLGVANGLPNGLANETN